MPDYAFSRCMILRHASAMLPCYAMSLFRFRCRRYVFADGRHTPLFHDTPPLSPCLRQDMPRLPATSIRYIRFCASGSACASACRERAPRHAKARVAPVCVPCAGVRRGSVLQQRAARDVCCVIAPRGVIIDITRYFFFATPADGARFFLFFVYTLLLLLTPAMPPFSLIFSP